MRKTINRRDVIRGSAAAGLTAWAAPLRAAAPPPVAIRQHDIRLSIQPPASAGNAVKATVARQVFLGANRDYMVETADRTALRVVTATENAVPQGSEVWLTLPPERCRALSR